MIDASEGYAHHLKLDGRSQTRGIADWETNRLEVEEIPAYYKRRSAGVWACIATLTVALGVAVVYGYAVLNQEGIQVEQIPGMAKTLPAISQNLAGFERRLAVSTANQQILASQVQTMGASSADALVQTRQQTGKLLAQMHQVLLKELNQQTTVVQAQVSQLLSEQSSDRLRVEEVEGQLAQTRSELEVARSEYSRELAAVVEQQGEERRALAFISSSLPTGHVTFEAPKNQQVEVAPGVSFQLTKAEVGHQRFDGWIESTPGNQKVWLQNQGVGNPVVFFPGEDGKALVMVVTRINEKGAVGYLLVPARNNATDQTDMVSATGNPLSPEAVTSGNKSGWAEP